MRKLVACLACRSQGTRLYGKPLQNLDIEARINILEYMISSVKTYASVSDIVLGISEGQDNIIYKEIAQRNGVDYLVGSEEDVLQRLIQCCEKAGGTDIFRLTTESPFTVFELVDEVWEAHVSKGNDLTALDNLPLGSGFEIIKLDAYKRSWELGEDKHRSELCSLYIREHKQDFKFELVNLPKELLRPDIRLTIDYPEDLILCRAIYKNFKNQAPRIPVLDIIKYLDSNPELKKVVEPYVAKGLSNAYL
jgi:spore coat polysaccharide biosynthesis protein SpsF